MHRIWIPLASAGALVVASAIVADARAKSRMVDDNEPPVPDPSYCSQNPCPNLQAEVVALDCAAASVTVRIRNTGKVGATGFVARVNVGATVIDRAVPKLGGGGSHTLTAPFERPARDISIHVTADAKNTIREFDEGDNTADTACIL